MYGFFKCQHCGLVDSIDFVHPNGLPEALEEQLCCVCLTGQEHGLFELEPPKANDVLANVPNGLGLG